MNLEVHVKLDNIQVITSLHANFSSVAASIDLETLLWTKDRPDGRTCLYI